MNNSKCIILLALLGNLAIAHAGIDGCDVRAPSFDYIVCIDKISEATKPDTDGLKDQIGTYLADDKSKIDALIKNIETVSNTIEELKKPSEDADKASLTEQLEKKNGELVDLNNRLYELKIEKKTIEGMLDEIGRKYSCYNGVERIYSESVNVLNTIMLSDTPGREGLENAKQYIQGCINDMQSFVPGKMERMREAVDKSLEQVDRAINTSLINGFKKDGVSDVKVNNLLELKNQLDMAKITIDEDKSLDIGWKNNIITNFYVGFEGTSVSNLKQKATSRIGFMAYSQPSGSVELIKNEKGETVMNLPWRPHLFTNILSTSSAEQSDSVDQEIKQQFEIDMNMFIPVIGRKSNAGIRVDGIIFSYGLSKKSDEGEFNKKPYFGYRIAHSPEFYYDIMYGKTESLTGRRMMLRGQMPVAEMFRGRIFAGMIVNFGVSEAPENSDSVKLYVTWQASFADFFK